MTESMKTCSRCIMDETVPGMRFDAQGVCHLCYVQDRLNRTYSIEQDLEKEKRFHLMVEAIKAEGKGKPHDCIVMISGGSDSSYTLYMAKKLGLRPLAYHFDNGWVSDIARENISRITSKLGVPVRELSYPWEKLREAYVASLKASIPEVCLPCLVATWSLSYKAAAREGIRYIIQGFSPTTEGIAPLKWSYVEGRYLEAVIKRHGTREALEAVRDFNRLKALDILYHTLVRRTKIIMLPIYLDWDDRRINELLKRELGWVDGGKHSDCFYTPFRNYVIWKKFGYELRKQAPAALVRSGRITRADALKFFAENPMSEDPARTEAVLGRLGLSRAEFDRILAEPRRSFADFPTYYPMIRILKPVIRWLARRGLIAEFVYDKYFEV